MTTIIREPNSAGEQFEKMLTNFWRKDGNKESEADRATRQGYAYQKICLLKGPPGNGKSSLLQSLAMKHQVRYIFVDLKSKRNTRSSLAADLESSLWGRCIVVFEDADSAMPKDGDGDDEDDAGDNKDDETNASETKSETNTDNNEASLSVKDLIDVLEAKGSKYQPAGRVVCFNTNKADALSGSLINFFNRQGQTFEFQNAGEYVLQKYWELFFVDNENIKETWETFYDNYNSIFRPNGICDMNDNEIRLDKHSPSAMQSYCMRFRNKPEEACLRKNVIEFIPHGDEDVLRPLMMNVISKTSVKESLKMSTPMFIKNVEIEHGISLTPEKARQLMDNEQNMVGLPGQKVRNKEKALDAAKRAASEESALIHVVPLTMDYLKIVVTFGLSFSLIGFNQITSKYASSLARIVQWINHSTSLGFQAVTSRSILDWNQQASKVIGTVPLLVVALQMFEFYSRKNWAVYRISWWESSVAPSNIKEALELLFNTSLGPESSQYVMQRDVSLHGKLKPTEQSAQSLSSTKGISMPNDALIKIDMSPQDQGEVFRLMQPTFGTGMHYLDVDVTMNEVTKKQSRVSIGWCLVNEFAAQSESRRVAPGVTKQHITQALTQYVDLYLSRSNYSAIWSWLPWALDKTDLNKSAVSALLSKAFNLKAKNEESNQILYIPTTAPSRLRTGEESAWTGTKVDKVKRNNYYFPTDDAYLNSTLKALLDDCEDFSQSQDFYRMRGIPYRRSHLLTGPDACGKVFFVKYLAAILGREINIIDFSQTASRNFTDEKLSQLVQRLNHGDILVLRNIDVAVSASAGGAGRNTGDDDNDDNVDFLRMLMGGKQKTKKTSHKARYTYAGILNILDGPRASTKGLITFVTTRRYTKLMQDKDTAGALLRPGRCEKRIHLNTPTKNQVSAMFHKMFTEIDDHSDERKDDLDKYANKFVTSCQDFEAEYEERWNQANNGLRRTSSTASSTTCWRTFAGWEEIQNYFKDYRECERNEQGFNTVVDTENVHKFLRSSQSAKRHKLFETVKEQITKIKAGLNISSLESVSAQQKVKDIVLDSYYVLRDMNSLATNVTQLKELLESDWSVRSKNIGCPPLLSPILSIIPFSQVSLAISYCCYLFIFCITS